MFIKGKIVSLRAVEPNDVNLLYQWENEMQLWQVSCTQIPFSKFIFEEFINASQDIYTSKQLRVMICNAENTTTLGCIDLYEYEPQHSRCGVGLYIHNSHRGKGYASEAVSLIVQYCFNILFLNQLHTTVNSNNIESLKVFEKNGFEKVGTLKEWQKIKANEYQDVFLMQLINAFV